MVLLKSEARVGMLYLSYLAPASSPLEVAAKSTIMQNVAQKMKYKKEILYRKPYV